MPIDRRARLSPEADCPVMLVPSMVTVPLVGVSSPVMHRMSVDFPAPERPTIPWI